MKLWKQLLMLSRTAKVSFELHESTVYQGRPYAIGSMGESFMVLSLAQSHSYQTLKRMNSRTFCWTLQRLGMVRIESK